MFFYLSVILFTGGGVASQHALQVSRLTPRGKLRGLAWGGGLQAHTWGQGVSPGHTGGGIPECTDNSASSNQAGGGAGGGGSYSSLFSGSFTATTAISLSPSSRGVGTQLIPTKPRTRKSIHRQTATAAARILLECILFS